MATPEELLLDGRTDDQRAAITSDARRLLVIAGAGSGKTDVMARRIAWWVSERDVPKDSVVAFTFGEAAAEEMKFRIRRRIADVTPEDEDPTLGGMYVGTIHSFCIKTLRELVPNRFHNYEIIDDAARISLIQRRGAFYDLLGLAGLQAALSEEADRQIGTFATIDQFLEGYDRLNQYGALNVALPEDRPPTDFDEAEEERWIREARMVANLGDHPVHEAFATSAARYYAYLHCRRFLDFSTSQMELLNLIRDDDSVRRALHERHRRIVVDECQDINEVQYRIINALVGDENHLTAVGDHRQAIYGWRGGRVEIMGRLHESIVEGDRDGEVVRLRDNFRSTPRIVSLANRWSDTIDPVGELGHPEMRHGRAERVDDDPTHVGVGRFQDHAAESRWIVDQIGALVRPEDGEGLTGAPHDEDDGERGLTYGDIAILLRSATDARTYMEALQGAGIPAVFQAGPDLFSQPEVLLFVAVIARMAGLDEFYGSDYKPQSLRRRVQDVLGCGPHPDPAICAACTALRDQGFPIGEDTDDWLLQVARSVNEKMMDGITPPEGVLNRLKSPTLTTFLTQDRVRRVFPQDLVHGVFLEAGVPDWDTDQSGRIQTAFFHLGQLSQLIREVESPGWTSVADFRAQATTLVQWGAENARTEEAPLLVPPNAVTISTIHSAKGLEFPVVFLADVRDRRFPSQWARSVPGLPCADSVIDPTDLADNDNYDSERRLMYVALTRSERFLFVTASGERRSRFFRELSGQMHDVGGATFDEPGSVPQVERRVPARASRDLELVTSFSDLRYFLECPHDFYLRKVLGFAPGIDRAIGYGQGIHNLLRAVHEDADFWAGIAGDPEEVAAELERLADEGLFYLRYTTGDPAQEMQRSALELVGRYVNDYSGELESMSFEPERDFETLLDEEDVLVTGAIDLVRLEDPPRVSLLDFKSGEAASDLPSSLDPELMRLQIKIYGLAARSELEYEPERGLVRYLAEDDPERRELEVALDDRALEEARRVVLVAARTIRERDFHNGPTGFGGTDTPEERCSVCDFVEFCGLEPARGYRDEAFGG